ncbi:MAG: hypothetical protein JSR33_04225, partial [Proteobacteria bacterium]|nr:hypothetical protein [Pseudomonadota bacterium]
MSIYKTTISQKSLWFINSLGGKARSAYNESLVFSISGILSLDALNWALEKLLCRHEILKISFAKDSQGEIFQIINENIKLDIKILETDEEHIHSLLLETIEKPFELGQAPLFRINIYALNPDFNYLVIVHHHIITDGFSSGIFLQELSFFYNKYLKNEKFDDLNKPKSYFEHTAFENSHYLTLEYQKKTKVLSETLSDYLGMNFLTTLKNKQDLDIFSGDRVYFQIEQKMYRKIKDFCKNYQFTPFNFLLTVYTIFLSKYIRSHDLVIGIPFMNRSSGFEHTLGFFVNSLPMRVKLNPDSNFIETAGFIKNRIYSLLDKQNVALDSITSQHSLSRLIQTMAVWAVNENSLLDFQGVEINFENKYFSRTSKFDFSLFMIEKNKAEVDAYFEFRIDLFDKALVEQLAKSFQILIENILIDPNIFVTNLSMLNESEKIWMKKHFFKSKLDRVVISSLGEIFSETAQRFPDRVSLVLENKKINYLTLEQKSNQWACYIRKKYRQLYNIEMPSDTLIALCFDRNEAMILGILGILKAGGAY